MLMLGMLCVEFCPFVDDARIFFKFKNVTVLKNNFKKV
jgi:hypothetical protein